MHMVNYGFGMPTRLVVDGDVARWSGRLVAHYGGTRALVLLGCGVGSHADIVLAALASLDRALLEHTEFPCAQGVGPEDAMVEEVVSLGIDTHADFILAVGDDECAAFARTVAARMAGETGSEDGFFPYGCVLVRNPARDVVPPHEPEGEQVPVFAIVDPDLVGCIGSPLRELVGNVCGAA